MKLQKCSVAECGATVLALQVDGRPMAVNPYQLEFAVAGKSGRFTLVKGYQPHHATCLDIVARSQGPAGTTRGK